MSYKTLKSDFFFAAKMAGLERCPPTLLKGHNGSSDYIEHMVDCRFWEYRGHRVKADISINKATAKAFGGMGRAFDLLEMAIVIEKLAETADGFDLCGMVAKSFDAVSQRYPIFRTYYELMLVGGRLRASADLIPARKGT